MSQVVGEDAPGTRGAAAAAEGAGARGAPRDTTQRLVQESVEVGRLREALDAQRAEFDDLQLRAQRDKHDAREQQQRLRAKLEAELAEVEDAHAAVLERKEAAVRKAQDQARRAQEELDVVEAEQRAAVHEALSLRKQLETKRSEERDAAQRTSSGMVEVLEGQKADLEAQVAQLRGSTKTLSRERDELQSDLEVARKAVARVEADLERYKLLLVEEKAAASGARAAVADAQQAAELAQARAQRAEGDLQRARELAESLRAEGVRAEGERQQAAAEASSAQRALADAAAGLGADAGVVERLRRDLEASQARLEEVQAEARARASVAGLPAGSAASATRDAAVQTAGGEAPVQPARTPSPSDDAGGLGRAQVAFLECMREHAQSACYATPRVRAMTCCNAARGRTPGGPRRV